ncbi:phzA/B-like protein [Pseudonocardiaceae bacterium YIM PH 21723]|nr:phzA/B-like protein [Pseudonocardiaceae bacterium YIM PH 21723]
MNAIEVFERIVAQWLSGGLRADLLAEDVVIEMPFALPGQPTRIVGRDQFVTFNAAGRTAVPLRIEECRDVSVLETADPETIVVEYELVTRSPVVGSRSAARFIGILTTRHGQIVHWREYQNLPAMAAAMGRLPGLVEAFD